MKFLHPCPWDVFVANIRGTGSLEILKKIYAAIFKDDIETLSQRYNECKS